MKNIYKILLVLFLIPVISLANEKVGKYTKTKVIKKEFNVANNATLTVLNKYGNINIVTWNKNVIEIEVTIKTNGDDEEKVENRLKQINIEFDHNPNFVTAKTSIEKAYSSWNLWGKKNNINMEINYQIKMPITNNVDLTNNYGTISIDKLEGTSKINCDYGKIIIGKLMNSTNIINLDYTNKSTIEFIKEGAVNADYSKLHIEKAEITKLKANYSHISFGSIINLDYNCDYGDLKIEDAFNLNGNSDYMHLTIGNLKESGDIEMDYGSLKINELELSLKNLTIESSYSQIKLGVHQNSSFNFKAALNYGSFKYDEGFTFINEIKKSSSKYYEGYYNSSNSDSAIILNCDYGTVSFNNK